MHVFDSLVCIKEKINLTCCEQWKKSIKKNINLKNQKIKDKDFKFTKDERFSYYILTLNFPLI